MQVPNGIGGGEFGFQAVQPVDQQSYSLGWGLPARPNRGHTGNTVKGDIEPEGLAFEMAVVQR